MRVLIANLKHLYQRRHLWFAFLFLGVIVIGSREEPGFVWFLFGYSGVAMGCMTREVMNKPFARFLPGHPAAARMVVFLTGLVVGTLEAALLTWHAGIDAPGTPVMFCAEIGRASCRERV